MLRSLFIKNVAIIDKLDLQFGPGLNVLTGETGAGKSIVLDALNLILGSRGGAELIRAGSEKASVDAVFDLSQSRSILEYLISAEVEMEDAELLISREISSNGKSSIKIGGRPATVSQLKEIAEWLVDLHGQHEHQSLLSSSRHIDILDEWTGSDARNIRDQIAFSYRKRITLQKELDTLLENARERIHLIDLYKFQIQEILSADLKVGEEDELRSEIKRLANAEKLANAAQTALHSLQEDGGIGAIGIASSGAKLLRDVATFDPELDEICSRVDSAVLELEECVRDLGRYVGKVEADPELLNNLQERIGIIHGLQRKYGETIEEILEYAEQTGKKLHDLENSDIRNEELELLISNETAHLTKLCAQLTAIRQESAGRFAAEIVANLSDLAMDKTRFEISMEPIEPGPKGAERIEFLIAPNPGEPLKPLSKIASGGEISRVMLAIKSAMAKREPLPTMVFDEIDVGVGGRTAFVVADKLAGLGGNSQVICITHLGQIASRANSHFYIEKSISGDRTSVSVVELNREQRVEEIVRMLGGDPQSQAIRQHAAEMLQGR